MIQNAVALKFLATCKVTSLVWGDRK